MKWMPEPPEQPSQEEILRRIEAFRIQHGREPEPQELWPEIHEWHAQVDQAAEMQLEREELAERAAYVRKVKRLMILQAVALVLQVGAFLYLVLRSLGWL